MSSSASSICDLNVPTAENINIEFHARGHLKRINMRTLPMKIMVCIIHLGGGWRGYGFNLMNTSLIQLAAL